MDLKNAHVLITGGSDGIGYGLAKRFINAGSEVFITGRKAEKLESVAKEFPGLKTMVSDISLPEEREALAKEINVAMPNINVLINNAGIQRRVPLAVDTAPWTERQKEIDILFAGPVHLDHLLIPTMLKHGKPSLIVNVTSGGAYIPQVFAPVYSACKAALHSYTITLRHALEDTSCRVVELIPPPVQTPNVLSEAVSDLNQRVPLNEFLDAAFPEIFKDGNTAVGYGPTANFKQEISGKPLDEFFRASLSRIPVATYKK